MKYLRDNVPASNVYIGDPKMWPPGLYVNDDHGFLVIVPSLASGGDRGRPLLIGQSGYPSYAAALSYKYRKLDKGVRATIEV